MKFLVYLTQSLIRDVCVNLGGGYIAMPEHHLDGPEIGPVLDQMSGKAMPQEVRGYMPDARLLTISYYGLPEGLSGYRLAS